MFLRYYFERFREIFGVPLEHSDGVGEEDVRSTLSRTGIAIPAALSEYYSLAGRHGINDDHKHLRTIAQLEWIDDKLAFMEENQCVVFWAIRRRDLKEADPVV
jgi:hypothetical protein